MSLNSTYRLFLIAVFMLLAGFKAQAQDEYVVLNSTHQYSVPNVIVGHTYRWRVFEDVTNTPLKFKKIADGEYVVANDGTLDYIEGAPVNIKWESVETSKKYVLVLTEENDATKCSVDTEVKINVVETPLNISFNKEADYRCADTGNDGFVIPIKMESSNTEISINYPITVEFFLQYDKETPFEVKTLTLESANDLTFIYADWRADFIEDQSKDHYFTFKFKCVKDKHGAEVKFNADAKYIFGAYKKPPITKINNK